LISDGINNVQSEECSCVNDCDVISFSPTISSSQLSTESMLEHLSTNSNGDYVTEHFLHALEIVNRADDSIMKEMISQLLAAKEAHKELADYINLQIINPATAITNLLSLSLFNLVSMAQEDIKACHSLLTSLNNMYTSNVDYMVQSLSSIMIEGSNLFAEVQMIVAGWYYNRYSMTSDARRAQVMLLKGQFFSIYVSVSLFNNRLRQAGEGKLHYFPFYLMPNDDCYATNKSLYTTIDEMITWLDDIENYSITIGGSRRGYDINGFSRNSTSARQKMLDLLTCLLAYKEELDAFSVWLNSLVLTIDITIDISSLNSVRSLFFADQMNLEELYNNYILNNWSKSKLAELFVSQSSEILSNAETLISDIDATIISTISSNVNYQQTVLIEAYHTLLDKAVSLQKYMLDNDASIELAMRTRGIWQKPDVNLQNSQVSSVFTQIHYE
jgi:bacterioferritin (cytochrome b1)